MALNKYNKLLISGANIWYFGEGMLGPLFAIFTERIGGNILDISWAWATYLIVSGLLYILVGKMTDARNNNEEIMILGYGLNALLTFGYLLVSKPWHLFLVQIGLGVASALATPTWDALFTKDKSIKNNGYRWGLAGGTAHIITGVAVVLASYIVSYGSFTALFLTMGTIQIIATIYQAQILWKKKTVRKTLVPAKRN